jgi:serine/threonine-protein kinase HipA
VTVAEVRLWGTRIGAVRWTDGVASFAYTPEFLASKIELAPITMPLNSSTYSFPALDPGTFHGLPGILADSLPDKYGTALIDAWLTRAGRTGFNPVDRLCYIGKRSMGALEYEPAVDEGRDRHAAQIDLGQLLDLANAATAGKEALRAKLSESDDDHEPISDILSVGTSAGGARAKAVVAWNPETGELRSGQTTIADGFGHWLMKFDGITDNVDKETADPQGFGRIEFAYHLMAVEAGIEMTECRLYEENERAHFMTRRFDRTVDDKLHAVTLCGLAHLDFNQAGAHSYEQAVSTAKTIRCGKADIAELYRRTVFNIVARNQDDHTKNIGFLMNRRGHWSLSPAYDVSYAYNPDGAWTSQHQMTVKGKRDGFAIGDLHAFGDYSGIKRSSQDDIIDQVIDAVSHWTTHAEAAHVEDRFISVIGQAHRQLPRGVQAK